MTTESAGDGPARVYDSAKMGFHGRRRVGFDTAARETQHGHDYGTALAADQSET